jgi:hypothetical protein
MEIDSKLGLIVGNSRDYGGVVLDVVPDDVLGLGVLGGDVGEAAVTPGKGEGGLDEFVDAGDGFAGPAVTDEAGPALLALVEREEGGPGCVRQDDLFSHQR